MFFGDGKSQMAFNTIVQDRLREREQLERQAQKDRRAVIARGHLMAGIAAARANAPIDIFPDDFDDARAAEAAWNAGRRA